MIKTNILVAELMDTPRPNRRRIQEILRIVWLDGRNWQRKRKLSVNKKQNE